MRRALAILLLVTFLPAWAGAQDDAEETEQATPAAASASTREGREKPRSCRVIAKQITHFESVVEEAKLRKNPLWQKATEAHVDNLRIQQFRRCPEDVPPSTAERIAELLKVLGRAALTASSFGAF